MIEELTAALDAAGIDWDMAGYGAITALTDGYEDEETGPQPYQWYADITQVCDEEGALSWEIAHWVTALSDEPVATFTADTLAQAVAKVRELAGR